MRILGAVLAGLVLLALATWQWSRWQLAHVEVTERVQVTITAPGRNALQIEHELAEPLEQALSRAKGLEWLRVVSQPGVVIAVAEVKAIGVEATPPLEVLREALRALPKTLPVDADLPMLQRLSADAEVTRLVVRSDALSVMDLSRWVDESLVRALEVQRGVRTIEQCGSRLPRAVVELDGLRLQAQHVTANDVRAVLQGSLLTPSVKDAEQLLRVPIRGDVQVRDVARFSLEPEKATCVARHRGVPVVLLTVSAQQPFALPVLPPSITVTTLPTLTGGRLSGGEHELVVERGDDVTVFDPGPTKRRVVSIAGADLDAIQKTAREVHATLADAKPKWLGDPWPLTLHHERTLELRRDLMAALGVSAGDVAQLARLHLEGETISRMADGTPVELRESSEFELAVLPGGVAVSSVLSFRETEEPAAILRVNRQRTIEFEVELEGAEKLQLPAGVTLH
jgi:multidrug efflux pump subunit AcrB